MRQPFSMTDSGGFCSQCGFFSWNGTRVPGVAWIIQHSLLILKGREREAPGRAVTWRSFHGGRARMLLYNDVVLDKCSLSIHTHSRGVCWVLAAAPGVRTTEENTCSLLWRCWVAVSYTPKEEWLWSKPCGYQASWKFFLKGTSVNGIAFKVSWAPDTWQLVQSHHCLWE